MTIHPHAFIYSSDDNCTITKLKSNNYEQIDTTQIEQRMKKHNIKAIIRNTSDMHYKIAQIKSPPYIIYYQGNINLLNKNILGIVGPRKPSEYGKNVIYKLFNQLESYNIITISGMASGIDNLCHNLSIQHNIPTIAVLGGGIKRFTESYHRSQINTIIKNGGLILSEYKLNLKPQNYTFPQRNRIIAGLSDVIFLPEAGKKSGSLITVDFALQMKKKIYGAPNSMFSPTSRGILEYIAQHKIFPIFRFTTMLDRHFTSNNTQKEQNITILTNEELQIFLYFQNQNHQSIQQLLIQCKYPLDKLLTILSNLEIKHYITQKNPNIYEKII